MDNSAVVLDIAALIHERSTVVDTALQRLWTAQNFPDSLALVAVGGYGRQELFPYSDIDVMVLVDERHQLDTDALLGNKIAHFLSACWDAKLEIGSSVRSIAECLAQANQDATIQTTLLETRCIAGSATLHTRLLEQFFVQLDAAAFCKAKMVEMRQRHQKYDDTPYSLEPNCKESPGGLRDLHMILWLAKATRLASDWTSLAKPQGQHPPLASEREAEQLAQNTAKLWQIRYALHLAAKRREDRLIFDLQPAVAELLGYRNMEDARRASEALMRDYYWTAKAVTQLSHILLQNIQERLLEQPEQSLPILGTAVNTQAGCNYVFYDKAGMIDVADVHVFEREPLAVLQTFLLYVREPGMQGLSTNTLRALYHAREHMDEAWRSHPENRRLFMEILQSPQGITHVFRLMNETSVLGRYLWAFRRIVGQMQHDLFHVYTVDQHILRVLRNVRRFFIAEHAHEYPLCSSIATTWEKPWLLYIAALFHDIGKGRGGDHSLIGAEEVAAFCIDHGLEGAERDLIVFLVREHLSLSQVAQKEDLSDPEVIAQFARRMGTVTRLNALYLLTVADIRGTSPKVWTAWKAKLLEDLYRSTQRYLEKSRTDGQGAREHHQAEMELRQNEALRLLALQAQPPMSHTEVWKTLGISYFMRHDAQDIAWHTRHLSRFMFQRAQNAKARQDISTLVAARPSPAGEGLQVFVYTPDATDLFARICGYFEHQRFSILDAKIHTTEDGCALDTFQVVSPDPPEQYRDWIALIERGLSDNIEQCSPLPASRSGRTSRRVKSFPMTPRVELHPDERGERWLLTISASDRLGLLYTIARVLAEFKIELLLAKISTLGERVEDTFLVRGQALQNSQSQAQFELALLQALQTTV